MTPTIVMNNQPINGILLVNKPQGLTSNAVLQNAKRLYGAKKAGHTGSLDPIATGMLPVCFGEATKFSQYLLDADKCYKVTGQLGMQTNTGDATGEIVKQSNSIDLSQNDLQSVLARFVGTIHQTPSMFSALKHQGQPLYKYARAGVNIDRPPREVTIHQLQLDQFEGCAFQLTVICSKGTYIRNLVEDIGEQLGVYAHVSQLHRCYTVGFENEVMHGLDDLQKKSSGELMSYLLPLERMVRHLPSLTVNESEIKMLYDGKVISDVSSLSLGNVQLYGQDKQFIGLGEILPDRQLKVKRLLANGQCT